MKRRVILVLLLLVAGAIVNLAVAWGCAWWQIGEARVVEIGFPSSEDAWLKSHDLDPAERITRTVAEAAELNARESKDEGWLGNVEFNSSVVPDFVQQAVRTVGFEVRTFWLSTHEIALPLAQQFRSGWPCSAFYGQATMATGTGSNAWMDYRDTWRSGGDLNTAAFPFLLYYGDLPPKPWRTIPLRPIWPGFAINTVFYALVLWLLVAAPMALRRRRRIKRGVCPKCAYDLRGAATPADVCPECGATR